MTTSLSTEKIKKLSQGKLAAEMLELLKDFPILKAAHVIDENGKATGIFDAQLLLVIFRDPKIPANSEVDLTKKLTGSSLEKIILEATSEEEAIAQLTANCAFAEALMQRAQQRGAKPYIWGQRAEVLANLLDNHPELGPKLKQHIYKIAGDWFLKTIKAGKDGLNPAADNLARLIYTHHPDDSENPMGKAIDLFTRVAAQGYLPSMDTLADFLMTDGTLTAEEHARSITAIRLGIQKTPQGSGVILAKLSDDLQRVIKSPHADSPVTENHLEL